MTIIFFARRFYPHIGGVEKHVRELSKHLIKKGHHVIIITEAVDNYPSRDLVDGIEVRRIFVGKDDKFKKLRIWKSLLRLNTLIKEADVVHCHDVFFWYLPFRYLYPNKPVYTTFHGYESYPITEKAIRMRKLAEKLSWGNICIGAFIKKWYGTKPTFVSYGAVDSSTFKIKTAKSVTDESAVFIGRLDEQTGILEYTKAIEILKKNLPKFKFLVVGDGKYKELLDKQVKSIGFQENPEKYFKNYHFAFIPRYLGILEAFAAKKLVVATYDNPVKEDYLKKTPFEKFIIIEKTPEKIAERVTYLMKHPRLEQKMINAAYEWVQKQTWDEMANLYIKLWKKKRA